MRSETGHCTHAFLSDCCISKINFHSIIEGAKQASHTFWSVDASKRSPEIIHRPSAFISLTSGRCASAVDTFYRVRSPASWTEQCNNKPRFSLSPSFLFVHSRLTLRLWMAQQSWAGAYIWTHKHHPIYTCMCMRTKRAAAARARDSGGNI